MTITVEEMLGDHPCPTCQGSGRVRFVTSLTDRERAMLKARYADDGRVLQTYAQLAKSYGLSAERIRQILVEAEWKIKQAEAVARARAG